MLANEGKAIQKDIVLQHLVEEHVFGLFHLSLFDEAMVI